MEEKAEETEASHRTRPGLAIRGPVFPSIPEWISVSMFLFMELDGDIETTRISVVLRGYS